jgi:hypothetical protein
MFGFLIIIAVMSGGLTFGVLMIIGAMLYSGKWTLPNSEQRKIQRASVRKEIARLESEAAQFRFEQEAIDAKREIARMQIQGTLSDIDFALRQKAIETHALPQIKELQGDNPPF